MTRPSGDFPSVSEICAHVKHLGYAASRRIRLYGEEFEVVSDPFPEAGGFAVHVTTAKDASVRVLRIPMTVLQSATRRRPLARGGVESAIVERGEKTSMDKSKDQDRGKGATEQDPQSPGGNTSMQGQLGHRDEDAELKNADSDLSG
jgi:hypothetical protein